MTPVHFSLGKSRPAKKILRQENFPRAPRASSPLVLQRENRSSAFFSEKIFGARITARRVHPKSDGKFSNSAAILFDGVCRDSH
jgi:hypothetical protein